MVQIQQKNSWAETKCTEIYFQFSFVQISPLRSYCCMHLLLWGCSFLWALKLAIPSSLLPLTSDWSLTKLTKRQWQKSRFGCCCCCYFFRGGVGGGARVVKENDFTFRASILLHLISLQASFFNITLWVVLNTLNSNILRLCLVGSARLVCLHKRFWTQKWVWYFWANQSHHNQPSFHSLIHTQTILAYQNLCTKYSIKKHKCTLAYAPCPKHFTRSYFSGSKKHPSYWSCRFSIRFTWTLATAPAAGSGATNSPWMLCSGFSCLRW